MIACIDDFCQDLHKKTVIVMDQASIHTSKEFTAKIPEWHAQNIEIFYLPAYAPELGYALKAGQLTYDCRYSTMYGMPVTGGRGFRGLKPLWYNGVPP